MRIRLEDYPQLRGIAWNRNPGGLIDGAEAFALYERNWRFVEEDKLSPDERRLIECLTRQFGNGTLNV